VIGFRRPERRPAAPAPDERVRGRVDAACRMGAPDGAVTARLRAAPAGYVLTQSSSDLVRHAALLEPLPTFGEVRLAVTPGNEVGAWHVDIGTRDRSGLLARFSGALLHLGIDVVQAVVATWDDGGALQALVVRHADAPDPIDLQSQLEWALGQPLSAPPVTGATVRFDPPSGGYTGCEVLADDRPGLLHAIAVAIAVAGADIHAARVATDDGRACDRFDLSDEHGRPLAPGMEAMIAAHLAAGTRDSLQTRRVRA
jgi:[protein-PII] uridylyltransferase